LPEGLSPDRPNLWKTGTTLKPPVWTWEIPVYFVVGGAAGAAALIAFVAGLMEPGTTLARDARLVALAGALLSPPLLISDLGRPERFLNMLRVIKLRSAMSVGAWTLVLFSAAVTIAVATRLHPAIERALHPLALAADATAAAAGVVLATYTGVLLAVTAIPVWAAHARMLPVHFAASSLGAAVSVLELAGHRTPWMNQIGIGAAVLVVATALWTELIRTPASGPLQSGRSGVLVRAGDVLAGLLPLVLRLGAADVTAVRFVAAGSAIVGSLLTRFGWLSAGRAAAADAGAILGNGDQS